MMPESAVRFIEIPIANVMVDTADAHDEREAAENPNNAACEAASDERDQYHAGCGQGLRRQEVH
jgi:hypothetical protein